MIRRILAVASQVAAILVLLAFLAAVVWFFAKLGGRAGL